jgi:hypothetical protein
MLEGMPETILILLRQDAKFIFKHANFVWGIILHYKQVSILMYVFESHRKYVFPFLCLQCLL